MPASDNQKQVKNLREEAEDVVKTAQQIAEETMDGVLPAQAEDYSGTRLKPEKARELYDRYCRMVLRGVESVAVLSKTLGVTRKTIYTWRSNYDMELRRREDEVSPVVERQKILSKLKEVEQALWRVQAKDDVTPNVIVSACSVLTNVLKMENDVLQKWSALAGGNSPFVTNYDRFTEEELSQHNQLIDKLTMVFQGGDVIPPEGFITNEN